MCHKLAQFYGQAEAKKDAERIEKDFARAKERSAKQIAKAKAKNGDDVKVWFFFEFFRCTDGLGILFDFWITNTSSAAQGSGGIFKDRQP
jgi:hypothetical protein